MRVRWLRGALRNLDQEAIYIAQDNPKAAAELACQLRDSALLLGEQPNLGRSGRIPGTRELILSNVPYILPYRVRNDIVEILRVFHTSRQWPLKEMGMNKERQQVQDDLMEAVRDMKAGRAARTHAYR